jgi:hypothetical protein
LSHHQQHPEENKESNGTDAAGVAVYKNGMYSDL